MLTLLFFPDILGDAQSWLQTQNLISASEKMRWEGMWHKQEGSQTKRGVYREASVSEQRVSSEGRM